MAQHDDSGRAADQVVHSIAERIRLGDLPDGQPLPPERDLMEEYGISRTVVREAVRTLSSRGLIEALPRHRPVVRKPGFDAAIDAVGSIVTHLLSEPGGVRNLFDTRIMVEAALARQAAQLATRDDIAALKEALEANAAAVEDSEEFYRTDNAFHGVLYQIPQNPVLPAIHRAYTTWLAPQWSQMPRLPERNRTNLGAHKAIYDAILMRDPDAAEARLRDHLSKAWAQVRETFGDV
ncbi:FadR/GntR family transcriptional regulator [Antarctobacter heliothermus]|uniref:DNA-binding transcriptional regulator, FadR family n=1 Tax=Antarctobacter heliothermus TaxID=74033 RepID=A0A239FXW7_9RHOB|nr:FadR/GntR family transcriptional regulator [Antarctobacter heliothermus]SNS61043.1 DNA-binding transcriptional regulator, FadR family [Antarctobacter heliothermus]